MTTFFNSVQKFVIPSILLVCGFRLSYGFVKPDALHLDLHLGSSVTASNGCKGNQTCEDQFTESECISYGICSLSCGFRDTYPDVAVLTTSADCQGDSPALPPAAANESNGHIFINSSTNTVCTVNTTVSADGDTGNFGISLWIQGSCSSNCTVLYGVDMSTPLVLDIVEDSLYLSGQSLSSWPKLSPDDWLHVVITKRINNSVDLYVNNIKQLFLAELTENLQGVTAVLGSVSAYTDNDTVTVWDARFYSDGLTDREIEGLYTGIFPPASQVSSCRCPASYPNISPDGFTCSTGSDAVRRLRKVFYEPSVLLDGLSTMSWVSTEAGDVQIVVDLGNSFQIYAVTVFFQSFGAQPTASDWAFESRNQTERVESTSPYSIRRNSLNYLYGRTGINTYQKFEKTVAEKIKIFFSERSASGTVQNYIIVRIDVSGWCDCDGAARTCTKTSGSPSYTCDCQPDNEPPNCRTCSNGVFREENGFGCFTTCPCYRPGVNASDICKSVGEQCNCKANVMGTRCNTCKHLAYNLQYDNDEGCTRSPCNETGTSWYDVTNMICKCKENVIGVNCTMCSDKHYGIESMDGCDPCDCDISGTLNGDDTCDLQSGQCNCKAKSKGRRCNECQDGFYNLTAGNIDGCVPCDCFTNGTVNANTACDMDTGNCSCKPFVQGRQCDECLDGFFNFDSENDEGCSPCDCNVNGTVDASLTCDQTNGNCSCKTNVQGRYCDQCYDGFYNLDVENVDGCSPCDCNTNGTINATDTCNNVTGECDCKRNVQGRQCDTCSAGFYDLDLGNDEGCSPCNCTTDGTLDGGDTCNTTGDCDCKPNVQGRQCGDCKDGFFRLEALDELGCSTPCDCDTTGTVNATNTCDISTGNCSCKSNVQGRQCNECQDGFYNLTVGNSDGCSPCECFTNGTVNANTTCDMDTGNCTCKPFVQGRQCDECLDGFFNFDSGNDEGCSPCDCNVNGTVDASLTCDQTNGNCSCKTYVQGRYCDQCYDGFYNLDAENVDGCSPCDCNTNGTINATDTCNNVTGECDCKRNVQGRQCDTCSAGFYDLDLGNDEGCSPCNCTTDGTLDGGDTCNTTGHCDCKPNVQGQQCSDCKDGFFRLEALDELGCSTPCDCDTTGTVNATTTCDISTGNCSCKSNVQGQKCATCMNGYYNLDMYNDDGCRPCECNMSGSIGDTCNETYGHCACKVNVEGTKCDQCKNMTYDLSPSNPDGCTNCACDEFGTESCDNVTGSCNCHPNVTGSRCDGCEIAHYGIESGSGCSPCECNINGTVGGSDLCTLTNGNCSCKTHVEGRQCDQCTIGFFDLDLGNVDGCSPCECNTTGTVNGADVCDFYTGKCSCKSNVEGIKCDACSDGFYNLEVGIPGGCLPCDCYTGGTVNANGTCDIDGNCTCKTFVQGRQCNQCFNGYYDLDPGNVDGCSPCQCNTNGTHNGADGCNLNTGECQCKGYVQGLQCDECVDGFYNFDGTNPDGCTPCNCNPYGSQTQICDKVTGICECKVNTEGDKCDLCKHMTYDLSPSDSNGCINCACDGFGTESCDNVTGSCNCHPNVTGSRCDRCVNGYYGIDSGSGCQPCRCDVLNPPTECEQIVAVVCPTADPGNQPAEPFGYGRTTIVWNDRKAVYIQ